MSGTISSTTDTVRFDGNPFTTEIGGTALDLGGGVVAALGKHVSIHATGDYTLGLGGAKERVLEANLGLTVRW